MKTAGHKIIAPFLLFALLCVIFVSTALAEESGFALKIVPDSFFIGRYNMLIKIPSGAPSDLIADINARAPSGKTVTNNRKISKGETSATVPIFKSPPEFGEYQVNVSLKGEGGFSTTRQFNLPIYPTPDDPRIKLSFPPNNETLHYGIFKKGIKFIELSTHFVHVPGGISRIETTSPPLNAVQRGLMKKEKVDAVSNFRKNFLTRDYKSVWAKGTKELRYEQDNGRIRKGTSSDFITVPKFATRDFLCTLFLLRSVGLGRSLPGIYIVVDALSPEELMMPKNMRHISGIGKQSDYTVILFKYDGEVNLELEGKSFSVHKVTAAYLSDADTLKDLPGNTMYFTKTWVPLYFNLHGFDIYNQDLVPR